MRVAYSIIFVSDMERSVAFYRDVVGMPVKFETPGWTEFATEGSTWALHKSDANPAGPDDPGLEPAGRCRPGFQVPDLQAFHARLVEQNVPCNEPPTEVFGAMIAQYIDPDGLVFSVGEERRAGGSTP